MIHTYQKLEEHDRHVQQTVVANQIFQFDLHKDNRQIDIIISTISHTKVIH